MPGPQHGLRTIGSDAAGEVVETGREVARFKPGDRVITSFYQRWLDGPYRDEYAASALGGSETDGVFAAYQVFDESGIVAAPDHLTDEEAATLPCSALTAWHALVPTAHVKAGDTVLVIGTGGVATFAVQFAKAHGARVVITSSSDEKLQRAKELGADELINYREIPEWSAEVLRRSEGVGVDIVVETGGAGTLPQSLRAVRAGGQISLIGTVTGVQQNLNIIPIFVRNIRLQGIDVGSVQMLEEVVRASRQLGLRPVIDRTFPFEQAKDALRYLASAQHFGKIVLTF